MKAHMKATAEIEKLPIEISFTLTVEEWRDIMRELPRAWPHWKFGELISDALDHLTKVTDLWIHSEEV